MDDVIYKPALMGGIFLVDPLDCSVLFFLLVGLGVGQTVGGISGLILSPFLLLVQY